jgi:hypothetical protein
MIAVVSSLVDKVVGVDMEKGVREARRMRVGRKRECIVREF